MADDLRGRVIAALEAAGFPHRENCLPTYPSGGTFSATGGGRTGVDVTCDWWDATTEELAGLRSEIAVALRASELEVREASGRLYVPPEPD